MASRPRRDSSDITSTLKGARGFSAFISRKKPGRFANSAPLMPSSKYTYASSAI